MFMTEECKYHAPCGLCTKYDKPCNEVCNTKTKKAMPGYSQCTIWNNGRCMGTKEMDYCIKDQCDHPKFEKGD